GVHARAAALSCLPGTAPQAGLRLSGRARVPPPREAAAGPPRRARVMGDVVEQHQARAHGVLELEDVETARELVEPIAVAPRIEAEQAADQQADRRLVRDDEHLGTGVP